MARNDGKTSAGGARPSRKRAGGRRGLATFDAVAEGIALLSIKLQQAGIDPESVLVSIPTETGTRIETEMQKSRGWRGACDGISLWADGHRKQIDLNGVRVHWRSTPPAW